MQLHQVQPKKKNRKKKRVGRGGKKGTYSGRGIKGQKSRAGARKMQPIIRELIKKYPKLRGYRQETRNKLETSLNLALLDKHFNEGDKITPQSLLEKGLIRRQKGRTPKVKILGEGEVSKRLVIEDCTTSKSAREKIEKAGGTIK